MKTHYTFKKKYTLLLIFAIMSGVLSSATDGAVSFFIVVLFALSLSVLISPLSLFLTWLVLSIFTQPFTINLPGNIATLTIERILFFLLVFNFIFGIFLSKKIKLRLGAEDSLLFLFLSWCVISILFLHRDNLPRQAITLILQIVMPISAYWVVQQIIEKESDLKKIFFTVAIIAAIISIPTPVESFFGITPLGQASEFRDNTVRVQSFLRSAWELGAVLAMQAMYSWHLWVSGTTPKIRFTGLASVVMSVLAIFLTFMRGAWLSLFAPISILLFLTKKTQRYLYLLIPLSITAIAFLLYSDVTKSEIWENRITSSRNVDQRLEVSKQQIAEIQQEPVLGNGLMPTFRTYGYGLFYGYTTLNISHNSLLSILVDFGFLGLLYYAAIVIILLKAIASYKTFPQAGFMGRGLILSLIAAALAFLINSLTFEIRLFTFVSSFFWVTLGLMKTAIHLNHKQYSASKF